MDQMDSAPVPVFIPSIHNISTGISQIVSLWERLKGENLNVIFSFSGCTFLSPPAVAFLGGVVRWIQSRGGQCSLDWNTVSARVGTNLQQNGFAHHFGHTREPWEGNSIPFREFAERNDTEFCDYLFNHWDHQKWMRSHLSEQLRNEMAERILEIYINAFEHAQSPIGIFTCGQYFPKIRKLALSIIDFGIGIPENVRAYFRLRNKHLADKLPADGCLNWAFQRGATTKAEGLSRGLGLDLLKSFIRLNEGTLEVYSHDGYALIDKKGEKYEKRSSYFEGSLFVLTIKCDESYYRFTHEK